jgi:hypothetical protein
MPQSLYRREETLIPIERKDGWEPWPVWKLERREKLISAGIGNPYRPAQTLVIVPATQFQ